MNYYVGWKKTQISGKKNRRLVQIQKPAFHARVRFVQVKTLLFTVTSALKAVWLSVKTFVGVHIIYDVLRLKTSFSLHFSLQKHTHTHTKQLEMKIMSVAKKPSSVLLPWYRQRSLAMGCPKSHWRMLNDITIECARVTD